MKIFTLSIVLLATLHFTLSYAQADYAFKVMVNKGQNEVKTGDAWQPVRTGASLKSTDELKLGDNAYIGLIHINGKPLELRNAGKYNVAELSAKMGGSTSVVNKYTDFILSSNVEKKNRLTATGAVHRGGVTTKVYLPSSEHAILFGDKVILDWERDSAITTYVVSLKSIFGDDLMTTETSTNLIIDLSDPKFAEEDNIMVEVYPKGQPEKAPDPAFVLKKLSKADKDRIKAQLSQIADINNDQSALGKLIMAGFYEENKLLIDAATAYQEAIALAPEVEQYKEDYNSFLIRNAIKTETK
ncbi:MAG TPA: hypothetical protein VD927_07605 [Chryseosolibacter sp.]|nr:hypothetical protein [Chryseosolibacter sp.]